MKKAFFLFLVILSNNIFSMSSYVDYDGIKKEIRERLARSAENINQPLSNGETPLYAAVKMIDRKSIRLLLLRGADLRIRSGPFGNTPLHSAVASRSIFPDEDLTDILLDFACSKKISPEFLDIANNDGETPLVRAIKFGHARAVCALVRTGSNVCQKDANNRTALEMVFDAAWHNDVDLVLVRMVKRLLIKGAPLPVAVTNIFNQNPDYSTRIVYLSRKALQDEESFIQKKHEDSKRFLLQLKRTENSHLYLGMLPKELRTKIGDYLVQPLLIN